MAKVRFRMIASAGDQVLSSVSNAVILFAMAGPSSIEAFGAAVLVFSIITAAIGLIRGAMGTPLLLMSAKPHAEIKLEASRGVAAAAFFGLLIGLVALVVSLALHEPHVGIAYAVAVPIVLSQDVLRFASMALGKPEIAFVSDAIWAVGAGAVLVVTWVDATALTIPEMIWWWAAAGAAAFVYLAWKIGVRPSAAGVWNWWRPHWQHRSRFGIESGIDQLGAIIIVSISTAFIGSVAAASLRGAVTVFGPFAVLISSLPLIVIPEAIRSGHSARQIWSTLRYAAWITSAFAVIIGFLAPFVPTSIGRLLLGDSWEVATHVLPFLGLEYAAICWIAGVYNYYRSQGSSAHLLRLRFIQSAIGISICTAMAATFGTVVGVAIGLALSSTLVAVGLVVDVQRRQWVARRESAAQEAVRSEDLVAAEQRRFRASGSSLRDRLGKDEMLSSEDTVVLRTTDLVGPRR